MIRTIEFNNEELLKALAKHFKIKPKDITFWHIRSIIGNGHIIRYSDNVS